MSRVKEFIRDYTSHCSNELVGGGYHEWLTPEQAMRAVEIGINECIKMSSDKLIQAFSFDVKRYKEYADKELKEEGKTQNYARLCGLADAYQRASDFVKQAMSE